MSSDTVRNMEPNIPNELGTEAKQYLQAIKRGLHCSRDRKNLFLKQMHESILQYLSEKPAATLADLTAEFGTPDEIARSFIEEADPAVVGKSLRYGWRIFWAVLAVAVIVAAIMLSLYFHTYTKQQDILDGEYLESITEIGSVEPESAPIIY